MISKSASALKSQKKTFLWIVVGALVVSGVLVYLITDSDTIPMVTSKTADLPGDKINPQDIWMSKIDNDNLLVDQRLKYLETLILENKKKETEKDQENDLLRQEIYRLKTDLKSMRDVTQLPSANSDSKQIAIQELSTGNSRIYEDPFLSSSKPIRMSVRPPLIEYVMGKATKTTFHVDKAIPAGTSVKALLVSSIDAPCGVYANSNPQPVKLRLLDNGHLPKEVMAKLKGGLIIASAYGDISTERIYMRLERLTKVERSGEFIETVVTGFVSGEDGKFGVRGNVVDKSGCLVTNAAVSGFFSGISQFLNTSLISAQSNKCDDPNPYGWGLLKASGLQGTSSAFDTLADYYIKRAEQIMPVIQVAAGRIVDITFTHKADLGDLYTHEKVREIRENSRRNTDG